MFYPTSNNAHGLRGDPFKAIVAPRPIGWISTLSAAGVVNLAPYSFFNAVGENPPMVMFSSQGHKDSLTNIEATGEFVCSIASYDLREAMNVTSASVGPEVDEMALAGLTPAPSRLVKPPRVAAAPAALECRLWQVLPLPSHGGEGYTIVIGEVVGVHIEDRFIVDGRVDTAAMQPIARLGYGDYAVVNTKFTIARPR